MVCSAAAGLAQPGSLIVIYREDLEPREAPVSACLPLKLPVIELRDPPLNTDTGGRVRGLTQDLRYRCVFV